MSVRLEVIKLALAGKKDEAVRLAVDALAVHEETVTDITRMVTHIHRLPVNCQNSIRAKVLAKLKGLLS